MYVENHGGILEQMEEAISSKYDVHLSKSTIQGAKNSSYRYWWYEFSWESLQKEELNHEFQRLGFIRMREDIIYRLIFVARESSWPNRTNRARKSSL